MIEVTFNDSLCGMLKMADWYSDQFEKNRSYASFFIFADIGDLSKGLFSARRLRQVNALFNHKYYYQTDIFTEYRWRCLKKRMYALMAACDQGEHLRIWSSNAPEELCATMALISMLAETEGTVSIIHLQNSKAHAKKPVFSWGELDPEDLAEFLADEYFLDKDECRKIAGQYEKLCTNSGILRAFENNELISVSEDYYDGLIREQIPNENIRMPFVVRDVLRNAKSFLPFEYLNIRCITLLCSPEFELSETLSTDPRTPHNEHRPPIYDMIFRRK